jgi:hypothetical protein
MKKTLLEMTQNILSGLSSEEVNSISDTTEAMQVASILEDVYYNLVSTRVIPEHKEMIQLVAASDSVRPTHFRYPDNVTSVTALWYDVSEDDTYDYKEIYWCEPEDFLRIVDKANSNYVNVKTVQGGTNLRITSNAWPTYFTSFDDDWVVLDSWKQTESSTLMSSKTRASVTKIPRFEAHNDAFIPDMDENLFPLLQAEAKVIASADLHGDLDSVADRIATRIRAGAQPRMRKIKKKKDWSTYGR